MRCHGQSEEGGGQKWRMFPKCGGVLINMCMNEEEEEEEEESTTCVCFQVKNNRTKNCFLSSKPFLFHTGWIEPFERKEISRSRNISR